MAIDYASFVAQGQGAWNDLGALVKKTGRTGIHHLDLHEVESLAAAHRRVVSDFAFARTRFPGTEAESRLRQLAFDGHRLLAPPEERLRKRLWAFLRYGYPTMFRDCLPAVGTAVALFSGATLFGVVVAGINPQVATMFIGPEALEELRQGHIWTDTVGEQAPGILLSTAIFTNNIAVGLMAWAGGMLLGLGTTLLLLYNGLMFGSILVVSWRFGLLENLVAFISTHGPLELFLIAVAGGAGLELGRGIIEQNNRPRSQTLAVAGRRSVRLMLGTVPWFVLAGLVEGTISTQMWLATPIKLVLGFALLGCFLGYTLLLRQPPGDAP